MSSSPHGLRRIVSGIVCSRNEILHERVGRLRAKVLSQTQIKKKNLINFKNKKLTGTRWPLPRMVRNAKRLSDHS
jgi:hypothetical protein